MTNPSTVSRGRARLGVLVPFTNSNLEADLAMLAPAGVTIHTTRLGGYDIEQVPDSRQMGGMAEADIEESLRLLAGVRPDVILYGCTSATLAQGPSFDRALAQRCESNWGIPMVTAASALVRSLQHLGVERIAFASPYVRALNDDAIAFLEQSGFAVVSRHDHDCDLGNYGQGELTPQQVVEFASRADSASAQAIVLSCTDMRAVEAIEAVEAHSDKPVVSSNQALLFWALKHTPVSSDEVRCGRLFAG